MHELYHIVRHFLSAYGYWAILIALLGENAGLPLPGETTLMFSSFLAHKGAPLTLYWIILVGITAAVIGDNLGFLLGRKFGFAFIRWTKRIFRIDDFDIAASKELLRRHGKITIFFARFIFGLRTVAGPLAGTLEMQWKEFVVFNFLGATVWVVTMSWVEYLFGTQFDTLLSYFEKASWAITAGVFTAGYLFWRKYKDRYREEHKGEPDVEAGGQSAKDSRLPEQKAA